MLWVLLTLPEARSSLASTTICGSFLSSCLLLQRSLAVLNFLWALLLSSPSISYLRAIWAVNTSAVIIGLLSCRFASDPSPVQANVAACLPCTSWVFSCECSRKITQSSTCSIFFFMHFTILPVSQPWHVSATSEFNKLGYVQTLLVHCSACPLLCLPIQSTETALGSHFASQFW